MSKPRILLGDDHALILSGVRMALEPRFDIVGQATDGEALVAAAKLTAPAAKLIFLSQHLSPAYLRQALQIGVAGYVLKSETTDELAEAIQAVMQGRIFVSPRFGADILSKLRNRSGKLNREQGELTERQRGILQLLFDGRSNKEIATSLELSIKTIEFHRAKIMSKLGARNASELARIALQRGIIPE